MFSDFLVARLKAVGERASTDRVSPDRVSPDRVSPDRASADRIRGDRAGSNADKRGAFRPAGWAASLLRLLQGMTRGLHAAERSLRVEEQLMLGGKKSLTLVSCDGRRYLLAASGETITPLIEVCPPREVHPRRAERRRYRDRPLRSSTIAVANGDGVASGFCDALAARAGRPDVEERL